MREFNEYYEWHISKKAEFMAEALRSKDYYVELAKTKEEARDILLSMIPEGSTIGLGGSQTVAHLDVLDELRTDKYKLLDRYVYDSRQGTHFGILRESLLADVFITGSNAVTMNGEIVNMDCSGSRAAAMMYGPKKVIIVVGVNKLVKDIPSAVDRLFQIAPMNCRKEEHHTPCVETGICSDCHVKQTETVRGRMCNYLSVIFTAHKFPGRLNVIVVADEMGF